MRFITDRVVKLLDNLDPNNGSILRMPPQISGNEEIVPSYGKCKELPNYHRMSRKQIFLKVPNPYQCMLLSKQLKSYLTIGEWGKKDFREKKNEGFTGHIYFLEPFLSQNINPCGT